MTTIAFSAILAAGPDPQGGVARGTLGDVMGAVTALSIFVGWPLAVFHWGTRYSGSSRARRRWGAIVILGVFVGAWSYWLFGTRARNDGSGSLNG